MAFDYDLVPTQHLANSQDFVLTNQIRDRLDQVSTTVRFCPSGGRLYVLVTH